MSLAPSAWRKTEYTHRIGTRADQPDADTVTVGTFYFVTDEFLMERSDGATWVTYSLDPSVGDWTPEFSADGGASGQVYDYQVGKYIKIGKSVFVSFYIDLNTMGSFTGNITIPNFPFEAANLGALYQYMNVQWFGDLAFAIDGLTIGLDPNTTVGFIYYIPSGGGTTMPIVDDTLGLLTNNTRIVVSGTYISED